MTEAQGYIALALLIAINGMLYIGIPVMVHRHRRITRGRKLASIRTYMGGLQS